MADTELHHFDSHFRFSSSPSGCEIGDDAFVMDSPLVNLDFGSGLVDEEVVVDSEDESVVGNGGGRGGNGYVLNLRKRRLSTPCLRAEGLLVEGFGGCGGKEEVLSADIESTDGGKDPMLVGTQDRASAMLNCFGSGESCNASQTNALQFVDQFLSMNNVNSCSSQGVGSRKMCNKSPPVLWVKGVQCLAKKLGNHAGNFDWDDCDDIAECEATGSNSISKWNEASLQYGSSEQKHGVRNRKDSYLSKIRGRNSDNEFRDEKRMVSSHEVTMNSVNGAEHTAGHSKKAHILHVEVSSSSVGDLDKQLYADLQEQELEDVGLEIGAMDMFDIGFNTQMAAEAIQALAYTPVTTHCPGDTYQGPLETLDFPKALTKIDGDCGHYSVNEGSCSGLRDVAIKSKVSNDVAKRTSRRTSIMYQKHPEKEGLDIELDKVAEVKKRKLSDQKRLSCRKSTHQYDISGQDSPKPTKLGKEGEDLEKKESKWSSPVAHRTRHWKLEKRLTRSKTEEKRAIVNMSSVMEFVVFQIRRKRSTLTADPYKVRARKKRPNWSWAPFPDTSNGKLIQKDQIGLDSAIAASSKLFTWSHTKRKRTRRSMKKCFNGVGYNTHTPIAAVDGSQESAQKKQLSVHTRRLRHFSEENTGGSSNASNVVVDSMSPTFSAEDINVINTTRAIDLQPNCRSFEHHKKTGNKSAPKKPALLKELTRLGVSEPMPDFTWKHLRRPWGIAYVQVLFSQNLGDDIVKQQKKIMSRLGISIASCSTDATHFIADKFARTRNMLESIVLGKPVVTHLWLESCGQAGCLIDEKKYILRDCKKEKAIGFSMPVTLARASEYPFLKGKRVIFTPSIKPGEEMISSLVKAACGQVVDLSQLIAGKVDNSLDDLLILSCEEDHAICEPFIRKGAAVYSSELLLNGIVVQKLEYERHQLFTNYAERKRSSRNSKYSRN